MGWENGNISAIHGTIINFNIVGAVNAYQSLFNRYGITQSERATLYSNVIPLDYLSMQVDDFIMGDNTLGLKVIEVDQTSNGKRVTLRVIENSAETIYKIILTGGRKAYPTRIDTFTLFTAVDNDAQTGCIFINYCQDENASSNQQVNQITTAGINSGGNFPYSLSTRGVNNLMYRLIKNDTPVPQGATIKVNYYLPDYDYTYAKITYKQDSEPASETDGESVEILKDETSVNIEGLEEEKTYYFKIFTDKSESEAFPYTVEVDPVPPEYKTYIDKINGSGFFFKDYPNVQYTNPSNLGLKYYPPSTVTWCVFNAKSFDTPSTWIYPYCIPIYAINITSQNGTYSVSTNITINNLLYQFYASNGVDTVRSGIIYAGGFSWNGDNPNIRNINFSGSLGECLDTVSMYFRNIDIYVDGVLWSKAGK